MKSIKGSLRPHELQKSGYARGLKFPKNCLQSPKLLQKLLFLMKDKDSHSTETLLDVAESKF